MKIKREQLILIFILIVGVFIRILLFRKETFIGIDAVALTRLGKNLIENGRYAFGENYNWGLFFPPAYPLLVGILNLFIHDLFISGKLISLFSSIITIFLFYLIGKEIHSKEAGLFAAFIYAIYTSILETSVLVETEGLFLFLLFLSIYLFIVSLRKNNFFIYLLLGMSSGMSYLTRPEGFVLLLLPFLSVAGCNPLKNKKHLFKIGITLIIFILMASPYLFFIKGATGRFSLSGKSSYLAGLLEANVTSEEIEYDKAAYALNDKKTHLKAFTTTNKITIVDFIVKKPFIFIQGYLKNLRKAMGILSQLLIPILLPLFLSFFNKDLFKNKKNWTLLLFAFLFFIIYPAFFILRRHLFPTVLFLSLFSSVGFVHSKSVFLNLLDFYEIKKNKVATFLGENIKYIIIIIIILGTLIGVFTTYFFTKTEIDIPVEHIKAGYFLKNNISSEYEKLNIMHRVPWVSFYSDAKFTMLPYAHYDDVINFAKLYKVDFIIVDERSSLNKWEFFNELINMEKYSDNVELIYEDNSGKLIKIFKVKYK